MATKNPLDLLADNLQSKDRVMTNRLQITSARLIGVNSTTGLEVHDRDHQGLVPFQPGGNLWGSISPVLLEQGYPSDPAHLPHLGSEDFFG